MSFSSSQSRQRPSRALLRLALVAGVCLLAAACGRRGALEYPVDPNDPRVVESGVRVHSTGRDGEKVIRNYVTPDRKFVLDPLL
ncbi:hypothetical protein [Pseudochelatococcus contaminans]|uniref:Putative small lipoprotein YifL n=1 Tax=Pseudochelatococcus contaminans TaxID=1538103 RepID=A0A7W5Z1L6_9HYPH|nr:hypothetical protein [Pseudochelatococcus contaminans]MBB3808376.1 putative small lipoprotein YifL [Pseudochelatococcus contaminans]